MTTVTVTDFQARLRTLMAGVEDGSVTDLEISRKEGEEPVSRVFSWDAYETADIAGSADVVFVPESEVAQGPASLESGLYTLAFRVDQATAIPDNSTHATYQHTSGPGGILYRAVRGGVYGNGITIRHVVAGNNTPLTVSVVALAVTVNVATNGGGVATSTMAQVAAAIAASAPASALLTATATGTTSTVTVAFAVQNLAGGAVQASSAAKFQTLAVYRERVADEALVGRIVLLSNAHAQFLGL